MVIELAKICGFLTGFMADFMIFVGAFITPKGFVRDRSIAKHQELDGTRYPEIIQD